MASCCMSSARRTPHPAKCQRHTRQASAPRSRRSLHPRSGALQPTTRHAMSETQGAPQQRPCRALHSPRRGRMPRQPNVFPLPLRGSPAPRFRLPCTSLTRQGRAEGYGGGCRGNLPDMSAFFTTALRSDILPAHKTAGASMPPAPHRDGGPCGSGGGTEARTRTARRARRSGHRPHCARARCIPENRCCIARTPRPPPPRAPSHATALTSRRLTTADPPGAKILCPGDQLNRIENDGTYVGFRLPRCGLG